jgi:hypothetical protein
MDTNLLVTKAKSRFNHNAAKAYLKDKYDARLLVADQGGLWRADQATISFLSTCPMKPMIMLDTFGNPVQVFGPALLKILFQTYQTVMTEWHQEWTDLEGER